MVIELCVVQCSSEIILVGVDVMLQVKIEFRLIFFNLHVG